MGFLDLFVLKTSAIEMKPLKITQQVLMWLCMCPAGESSSVVKKVAYTTISLIIFAINFGCTFSGFTYVVVYRSTDLKGCLFAFMASSATLVVLYTMTSAYYMRHGIKQLFEKLSVICRGSKC